jgi:hypothetical protein
MLLTNPPHPLDSSSRFCLPAAISEALNYDSFYEDLSNLRVLISCAPTKKSSPSSQARRLPQRRWESSISTPFEAKGPANVLGLCRYKSLTMSYFHTGIRTIIGAEAFHCPVRDGKEWDHLAMVIRHNLLPLLQSLCLQPRPIRRVLNQQI